MSTNTETGGGMQPPALPENVTVEPGGAGRGGATNSSSQPLVVVNDRSRTSPPRPAPPERRNTGDGTVRNGYAAIAHSISGETAAIGSGFLLAGPAGAIVAGALAPVAVAAVMWRSRRREDDENANDKNPDKGTGKGLQSGRGGPSGRGSGAGRGSSGSGRTPGGKSRTGSGSGSGAGRKGGKEGAYMGGSKPKTKDPVGNKAAKIGKGIKDKIAPARKNNDPAGKGLKGLKNALKGAGKGPTNDKGKLDPKKTGDGKPGSGSSGKKLPLKGRGKQPDSDRPWRGRGSKHDKTKKDKHRKDRGAGDAHTSGRDGLVPRTPKGGNGRGRHDGDVIDGELVDDPTPPKPGHPPHDILDGEIVEDEPTLLDRRIEQVEAKRIKDMRRQAIAAGKKAARKAARDKTGDDPHNVRVKVTNKRVKAANAELKRQRNMIALATRVQKSGSTHVNYPAVQSAPAVAVRRTGAVARQVDPYASMAWRILREVASAIIHGQGEDGDMADHIVELNGVPAACSNFGQAVREAADTLIKTAPIHPNVIKHLREAAISATMAQRYAEGIMPVLVTQHRDDIIRAIDPRTNEWRWNISGNPGSLTAGKLRAALAGANQARLALPVGPAGSNAQTGGRLVARSQEASQKIADSFRDFDRAHMTDVISEIAGAGKGINEVATALTHMYKRMASNWPTDRAVDDMVAKTAGHVAAIGNNLDRAVRAAQTAHQKDLKRNQQPRKGPHAENAWSVGRN